MRYPFYLIVIFSLLLSGCQMYMQSDVTVFHELPVDVYGKTYAFQPASEQETSLEYKTYAEQVRQQMFRWGFVEKPASVAEWMVVFTAGVDDGKTIMQSSPEYAQQCTPVYNKKRDQVESYCSQTYVGSRTRSSVLYRHTLKLSMHKRAVDTQAKASNVYEGTVVADESSSHLSEVMPYLVKALFTNFPGASGQTRHVRVPLPKPAYGF